MGSRLCSQTRSRLPQASLVSNSLNQVLRAVSGSPAPSWHFGRFCFTGAGSGHVGAADAMHTVLSPPLWAANCCVWLGLIHFQAFPPSHSSFGGVCWFSSSAKLKTERQKCLLDSGAAMGHPNPPRCSCLLAAAPPCPGDATSFWGVTGCAAPRMALVQCLGALSLLFQHKEGVPGVAGPELLCTWAALEWGCPDCCSQAGEKFRTHWQSEASEGEYKIPGGVLGLGMLVAGAGAAPVPCPAPHGSPLQWWERATPRDTSADRGEQPPPLGGTETCPVMAGNSPRHSGRAATSLPTPCPSVAGWVLRKPAARRSQKLDFAHCSFANKSGKDNNEAASPALVSFCFIFLVWCSFPLRVTHSCSNRRAGAEGMSSVSGLPAAGEHPRGVSRVGEVESLLLPSWTCCLLPDLCPAGLG